MKRDSWIPALGRIERLTWRLRGEDGCEWDRAQTPESLTPYLIEEMHEALDALRMGSREKLGEEIGDALYLWVLFLQVLEDSKRISIEEAVGAVEQKLIRRHPHVFGVAEADGTNGAVTSAPGDWERRKLLESPTSDETIPPLPAAIPALLKARRVQEKAAAFGFDWRSAAEVLPKVREEVDELEAEIKEKDSAGVQDELGDAMFALVNLSRHLGIDPEAALRSATEKFRLRFNAMTRSVEAAGHHVGDAPLDLMESHWNAVKNSGPNANPREDRP